jgi:hypothetical protein
MTTNLALWHHQCGKIWLKRIWLIRMNHDQCFFKEFLFVAKMATIHRNEVEKMAIIP